MWRPHLGDVIRSEAIMGVAGCRADYDFLRHCESGLRGAKLRLARFQREALEIAMKRVLVALALCSGIGGCAYNESLGRNQLLLVDDSAFESSARQAWDETIRSGRVSRDPVAGERVVRIGSRIVQAAGMGNLRWQYVVFESNDANAFALPGGRMGVTTGLLRMVRNDDQLAAVIGHEVGHIGARHAAERYSQSTAASIGLGVAQGALGSGSQAGQAVSAFGGAGAQLGFLLPFSRQHELEADRLGVDYMQAAGYDPRQAVELWRLMAQEGSRNPAEFMSTHPSEPTRIAALEAYLRQRGWL